jgi:putative glycosyltransferase (TIGR04348 family)
MRPVSMQIRIVTPAPQGSQKGNRVTALRWAGFLRDLGHHVTLEQEYDGHPGDLLLALHARRSYPSVERFRERYPDRPLLVALTGTDVYQDLATSAEARRSLEWATRIVALQPLALAELPEPLRARGRVIYQSAGASVQREPPSAERFEVCVLGHLREVKDPFRAAEAARLLPPESRLCVLQAGAALEEGLAERARWEERRNPRYRWLGELPRDEALAVLARSRLLVLTSRLEGGANVVSEAVVAGVPVVSSRIPGSVGLLGEGYPGYFEFGDTRGLADLLHRAETAPEFYARLHTACAELAPRFHPDREREGWAALLAELEHSSPA